MRKGKAVVKVRGDTPWLENMTSVWPVAQRRRRVGGTLALKNVQSRSLQGKVLPATAVSRGRGGGGEGVGSMP